MDFKRDIDELRNNAILHWPKEVIKLANNVDTLPLLLSTQDAFLSILKVSDQTPQSWIKTIENSRELDGNLFLKHLMVLSDLGGEALNKLPPLINYIPESKMIFEWFGKKFYYELKVLGEQCSLTNSALNVDLKNLPKKKEFTKKSEEVCMLILFGNNLSNDCLPETFKDKCIIGNLLGNPNELNEFVKQRYLHVSKQVSGATANSLGHIVQKYVAEKIKAELSNWTIKLDSSLPNVFHSEGSNETNFDVVAISPSNQYFGIEVSFQVTTNSVIERKARESSSMIRTVHSKGHKLCYVIDGAGNINIRKNAVQTLCNNSDCTVAMSDKEISVLVRYLKENG